MQTFFKLKKRIIWKLMTTCGPHILSCAKFYRRTIARQKKIILVTGTYGKTTTVRAIRHLFGMESSRWVDLNTNHLGEVGWTILKENPWASFVVVEAGISQPGKMKIYADTVRPDLSVITHIGLEHAKTFQTVEAIRHEKAFAVRVLGPSGTAVLNGDDPHVRWMATQTAAQPLWFGFDRSFDVYASEATWKWPQGMQFMLTAFGQKKVVRTRLQGQNMIYPILGAVTAGLNAGVDLDLMINRIESFNPTIGRLELIRLSNGAILIDDSYKATLETVFEAFEVLKQIPAKRKLIVIGDLNNFPSDDMQGPYREAGIRMAGIANLILIVGKRKNDYLAGINLVSHSPSSVYGVECVQEASDFLASELKEGDVALIKGYEDQGLRRICLFLQGKTINCKVNWCLLHEQSCDDCPLL